MCYAFSKDRALETHQPSVCSVWTPEVLWTHSHASTLLLIFTLFYIYTLYVWEFEPSLVSPMKSHPVSLWPRLHCCVRRPCQPWTEVTWRSADGILQSVRHVPMVLQVCSGRDCDCEPGHVFFFLVSVTPSQPHCPAAFLHLHFCMRTYIGKQIQTLRGIYVIMQLLVCGCVYISPLCEWKILCSHLYAAQFSIPLSSPVRLLSCLTRVFVSSSEGIENTTCHRLFGGLSLFLHGRMFIIPSL